MDRSRHLVITVMACKSVLLTSSTCSAAETQAPVRVGKTFELADEATAAAKEVAIVVLSTVPECTKRIRKVSC